jgi:hypothetical protein
MANLFADPMKVDLNQEKPSIFKQFKEAPLS